MIVRYQKTTGEYANPGDGINSDGSANVRLAGSRTVVGADSVVTWATGALDVAKSVTYSQPSAVGTQYALFVMNNCASVSLTVDIYCRQTAGGSVEFFLLTSFSMAANTDRVLLLSHLFAGSDGCRVTLTPSAAATNGETARVLVREVA